MMRLSGKQRRVLVDFLLSKIPAGDAISALETMLSLSEVPQTAQIRRRPDPFSFALSIVQHCEAYGDGPAGTALDLLLGAVSETFGGEAPEEVKRLSEALLEDRAGAASGIAAPAPGAEVFLCYNSRDRESVTAIASALSPKSDGLWMDVSRLQGGDVFVEKIAAEIARVRCALVLCGRHGIGRWQQLEVRALLRAHAERATRIVPVVLADAPPGPVAWPDFLRDFHEVDLRSSYQEGIRALVALCAL